MSAKPKPLTKSRFKIGCECPTKLYFTNKPEYGNNKSQDSFLKSLAEGGFQVGELAKLYVSGGSEVETLDYDQSVAQTEVLLKNDNVVIYEAAFRHESLFVRVDIVRKSGDKIELIEVKAKSADPENLSFYKKKTRELDSDWEPYLLDVAFQTHVMSLAHPEFEIAPFLMLADKASTASVDGLNQRFLLISENGRTRARINDSTRDAPLGNQVLRQVDVSKEVSFINSNHKIGGRSFVDCIEYLASVYSNGSREKSGVSSACKSCEFRIDSKLKSQGLKSGFEECWTEQLQLRPDDFKKAFAFEIWNSRKTDDFLINNIIFMDQVSEESLAPQPCFLNSLSKKKWCMPARDPARIISLQMVVA